ncbi:DUF4145 domain-containing protein [Bacillaceae bacterium W0354]
MIEVQALTFEEGKAKRINKFINKMPDICPLCNKGIRPIPIEACVSKKLIDEDLQYIFKCTLDDCKNLFIAYYTSKSFYGDKFTFRYTRPVNIESAKFPEEIESFSKDFINIYNQAQHAEKLNLDQIAGVGYRKSLEFLIKDYLIKVKEKEEESIKKTYLATCINNFIDDQRIKNVAERAAWLGNDETHYHRKFEDKDIKDLKDLIELTVYWITSEIKTEILISEMQKK